MTVSKMQAREGAIPIVDGIEGTKYLNAGTAGKMLKTQGETDPTWVTPGQYVKSTKTPAVGLSGVYGAVQDISPATGFNSLLLMALYEAVSGIAGGETITISITATFSDATTAEITFAHTADGSSYPTATSFVSLSKDATTITKISIKAKTDGASTVAVVTATVLAINC